VGLLSARPNNNKWVTATALLGYGALFGVGMGCFVEHGRDDKMVTGQEEWDPKELQRYAEYGAGSGFAVALLYLGHMYWIVKRG
jgi:hypothetical protein